MRDRQDPFRLFDEEQFIARFRFRKETVLYIVDLISPDIDPPTRRHFAISAHIQVLLALAFYATGSFQITLGDIGYSQVHQSTMCRIIRRVSEALARRKNDFIIFPRGAGVQQVMRGFRNIATIPHVVGAIDCTHVKIANPGGDHAARFINRKGYFSLNCQFTCTADLVFTSIVTHWPGSTHDARIFRECALNRQFEQGELQGILLGDAGYPCLPYLLTPVNNPRRNAEQRYNYAHSQTRTVVERAFGVMKRRFACLHYGLRLRIRTDFAVITAVAVLHNIAMRRGEPPPVYDDPEQGDPGNPDNIAPNQPAQANRPAQADQAAGKLARSRVVQLFDNQ